MSKDMEYYNFKDKIEKIKTKAESSENKQHVQQCIDKVSNLFKELDDSKQNENYEIYNLIKDTCKEFHKHKRNSNKK